MKKLGTTTRIAFAMAMWSASMLLTLRLFGLWSDGHDELLAMRTRLCESTAISCSQFVSQNDIESAHVILETLVRRNPDILSAACRLIEGELPIAIGDHAKFWTDQPASKGVNCISVPVLTGDQLHSHVEVAFRAPVSAGMLGFFQLPTIRVTLAATLLNLLGFSLWMRRCFRHLDPSQAVPDRVRSALDTMAEVVVVLDEHNHIMLANRRLAEIVNRQADDLQGHPLSSLSWQIEGDADIATILCQCLTVNGSAESSPTLRLKGFDGKERHFKPNASIISDEAGVRRGTLLSLDDITLIEEKNAELRDTLARLKKSREEIAEQNVQLRFLATRDPMTGCYNRRSFFENFETLWKSSGRYGHALSCVMVDVDHFKSINDRFGHAMGDNVLKQVSATLLKTARDTDFVCRYGGEEFCVLLPHVDIGGAQLAAERLRVAIAALEFPELRVTASLGCADRSSGAEKEEGMLEQADQALYHAKRNGRNQVARFDQLPSAQSSDTPEEKLLEGIREISADLHVTNTVPDDKAVSETNLEETDAHSSGSLVR